MRLRINRLGLSASEDSKWYCSVPFNTKEDECIKTSLVDYGLNLHMRVLTIIQNRR
jgi:hypothetical protein